MGSATVLIGGMGIFGFEEQTLIEESKKHCEEFLQKEQRLLATFTGDSSLMLLVWKSFGMMVILQYQLQ